MCKNFGIQMVSAEDGAPAKDPETGRRRYDFSKTTGSVTCTYCNKSFTPRFNEALRPILRHFLSLSLPYAACSTPDCRNFGKNVFENYSGAHRDYRERKGKDMESHVVCRGCQKGVALGEPLRLRVRNDTPGILDSILFAFLLGAKKRRTVHFTQMFFPKLNDRGYYRALYRSGKRLGSYHAWRNARLLDGKAPIDFTQTARVYTDVMEASLRRLGDVHRHRRVLVMVSVLALEKTYFILAAHPYFLPDVKELKPGDYHIDPATGLPSVDVARRWDCVEHPIHTTFKLGKKRTPEHLAKEQADVSRARQGYYITPAYAELAHILVVRTMLRRFERVFFYVDAHKSAINSAMVGLADEIRSGRVEVALFQRKYKKGGRPLPPALDMGKIGSAERAKALLKCWKATEQKVRRVFEAGEDDKSAKTAKDRAKKKKMPYVPVREKIPDPAQRAARAFNRALLGGFDARGEWAWLRYPSPLGRERECRTLWLTRMPHKTYSDAKACLRYATLQPVDSAMQAIRSRVRAADRPRFRAAAGSSFIERYFDPLVLLAELSIYLFARNYMLMSADQPHVPAWKLGLAPDKRGFSSSLRNLIMKFRLTRSDAAKMSRWQHQ